MTRTRILPCLTMTLDSGIVQLAFYLKEVEVIKQASFLFKGGRGEEVIKGKEVIKGEEVIKRDWDAASDRVLCPYRSHHTSDCVTCCIALC